jgi:hypothetical protein
MHIQASYNWNKQAAFGEVECKGEIFNRSNVMIGNHDVIVVMVHLGLMHNARLTGVPSQTDDSTTNFANSCRNPGVLTSEVRVSSLTSGPFGDSISAAARPKCWGVSLQTKIQEVDLTEVKLITLLTL